MGANRNVGAEFDFSGKHILLVEDHPINIFIQQWLLEDVGCQVTVATDGKQGVEQFNAAQDGYFDAILMDINMPVMDGWTAAEQIRSSTQPHAGKIPIIALTTNGYREDINHSMEVGMNEHLVKPLNPDALFRCLAKYLDAQSA